MAWGELPLMTLPFLLVFLLWFSSLAEAPEKDRLGLEVEGVEGGGLMKGPAFPHYRLLVDIQCSLDLPVPPV